MADQSSATRKRMKAPQRRDAILDAAERSFARLGYHAAGMAEIAAGAGITQPMLYRHFSSKRELFLEVLDRAVGQIEQAWQGAPDMVSMGVRYGQLAAQKPDLVRLRLQAMTQGDDPEIRERYLGLYRRQLELVRAAAVREVGGSGLVPEVTVEQVTWLFTALGMLNDALAALEAPELCGGVEEAATLFWRLLRPGGEGPA